MIMAASEDEMRGCVQGELVQVCGEEVAVQQYQASEEHVQVEEQHVQVEEQHVQVMEQHEQDDLDQSIPAGEEVREEQMEIEIM